LVGEGPKDRRTRNRRRCLAPRTGNGHWHPSPEFEALAVTFLDRQGSTILDVVLHIGAWLAPAPHLEPAGNASSKQSSAGIEDWIAHPFDQGLAGVGHPIALALRSQSDRLKLNSCRPLQLLRRDLLLWRWRPVAWGAVREKFRAKHKSGKKARKAREKEGEDVVDGRSLKATGRTEHCNLRCTPEVKDAFHKAAAEAALGLSIWLERAILAAIDRQNRGETI
jgi:hypothetical protein